MAEADLLLAQAANIRLTPQEDYEAEDETRVTFVPRVPAAARTRSSSLPATGGCASRCSGPTRWPT
jgi:hypothetical protein